MRYHSTEPDRILQSFGETYICDHPLYNSCTLYLIGLYGLAVIQQRFDPETKQTRWTEIDPWLTNAIFLNHDFKLYFDRVAGPEQNGLYPTVTVRQIMWALRMKPLPKQPWETVFDRPQI